MVILFYSCSLNAGNEGQEKTDEEQMVIEKSIVLSGEDGGSITASLTSDGLLYFEEENASGPESEALILFRKYNTDNGVDFNGFCKAYTGLSSLDKEVNEFSENINQKTNNFDGIQKAMLFSNIGPIVWTGRGEAYYPTAASFNADFISSRARYLSRTGYSKRIRESIVVCSYVYCYRSSMVHKIRYKSNNASSWKAGPLNTMKAGQYIYYQFVWRKTVDPIVKVETYNVNDAYPSGFHQAMDW